MAFDLSSIGTRRSDIGEVNLSTLGGVLNKYGQLFVDGTKRILAEKGKDASHALSQSIAFEVLIVGQVFRFTIVMEDYWEAVDKGRKSGKPPKTEDIIKWIHNKPKVKSTLRNLSKVGDLRERGKNVGKPYTLNDIIKSSAIGMAKAIGKKGTKGSNFYSDVINDKSIEALKKELKEALGRDVQITIKDIADSINKK